jgi:2-oxoisovalerate dehydrogenase E1 component alpha subunit
MGASKSKASGFQLDQAKLIQLHDFMVQGRVMEERLIRMYKTNQGYFWLGGPGEEAFSIPLAMQIRKGQGPDYDYMHFHYRAGPIMLALGMNPKDAMRQMANVATDPFSGGRNFCSHYSKREWNVVPVTSTIETQYLSAIGTGIAQARDKKCKGITIVTGGDAGTAEGDFASCLLWASRPALPLPLLIIVTNNSMGISTPTPTQQAMTNIADRGKAFGMRTATINGNNVEESWFGIREAMEYVRTERKPFLLEAKVSRLFGHSSATGANLVAGVEDPIITFEAKLEKAGILTRKEMDSIRENYNVAMLEMSKQVKEEPMPDSSTIYDHTFAGQKGKYW